ncbi:hypothetical protein GPZ77_34210 (plasmid) [Streptomyces sp. QHH-9511]|uniref:hypothetical protein n=1 Tax=Streptomyces sp. QHH-9511 TaxID=2684468 RepID=UPI0013166CEC|nr:hypothetical protein [Streptomyces sp. QHH-9511]QGZ53286.1 hypothetical protein GPZ77_34210 [Streptomyces sp. QHH-9511]
MTSQVLGAPEDRVGVGQPGGEVLDVVVDAGLRVVRGRVGRTAETQRTAVITAALVLMRTSAKVASARKALGVVPVTAR